MKNLLLQGHPIRTLEAPAQPFLIPHWLLVAGVIGWFAAAPSERRLVAQETAILPNQQSETSDPNPSSVPEKKDATSDLPLGIAIPGRPGFVNSPFAAKHQLVDVTGLPAGMEVKCPYSGKLFRVPPPPEEAAKDKPASPPTSPAPQSLKESDLPYGTAVPGRPGFVNSPFAAKHQLVDVTGLPAGMEVKCPYSGKLFRIPPQ